MLAQVNRSLIPFVVFVAFCSFPLPHLGGPFGERARPGCRGGWKELGCKSARQGEQREPRQGVHHGRGRRRLRPGRASRPRSRLRSEGPIRGLLTWHLVLAWSCTAPSLVGGEEATQVTVGPAYRRQSRGSPARASHGGQRVPPAVQSFFREVSVAKVSRSAGMTSWSLARFAAILLARIRSSESTFT